MQKAYGPGPIVPEPPCRAARPMGFMSELRKVDNIRREPISARDAHTCWTGAVQTFENCAHAKSERTHSPTLGG
jgi:hypothetical protein